uniref:DNA-directed RNA polymerase III subunit RPC9 n=2 Tax=Lygus hesperus TaxID=30085 RepID=A0A146L358_LYGHE
MQHKVQKMTSTTNSDGPVGEGGCAVGATVTASPASNLRAPEAAACTVAESQDQLEREITQIQLQISEHTAQLHRLFEEEQYVWCIDTTRNYLNTRPGRYQNPQIIETFFNELSKLNQINNFDIITHEALQLLNHRPILHVDIQLIIEHFYERVRNPDHQQLLLDLCATLPPVIPDTGASAESTEHQQLNSTHHTTTGDTDTGDDTEQITSTLNITTLDSPLNMSDIHDLLSDQNYLEATREDDELINAAGAQIDAEDDAVQNDDDEGD